MSEPIARNRQLGLLGVLPVEIRHRIYHFVALRNTDFILKVWFEKIDPNIDTSTTTFASYPTYAEEENEEDEDDEEDDDDGGEDEDEETTGNNRSDVVNGSGETYTQGHSEDVTMVDATQVSHNHSAQVPNETLATQVRGPIHRVIEFSGLARTNLAIGYTTRF